MGSQVSLQWPVINVPDTDLKVFDGKSNIALCVNHGLSTARDVEILNEFVKRIPPAARDKIHAAGVLTVIDRGVQILLANILSNPSIDTLILAGHETLFQPSTALLLLKEKGYDKKTRQINGYCEKVPLGAKNRPFLGGVPDEALELFISKVKVIDARLRSEPVEQYFSRLGSIIEENYRPIQSEAPVRDFDFSALQPQQYKLPAVAKLPIDTGVFDVLRTEKEVITQTKDGNRQLISFTATEQDALIHEVNAWASRENNGPAIGDSVWFSLGRQIAQAFLGRIPQVNPGLEGSVVKSHIRRLELDPKGYFELTVDPVERTLKAIYAPAEPSGRRFELLINAEQNDVGDLLRYLQENDLFGDYPAYPGRVGHLIYLGAELEKAFVSAREGFVYSQDKPINTSLRINTTDIYGPVHISAQSSADLWRSVMYHLEREGHHTIDAEKGPMDEAWCILWQTSLSALNMPDDFDFFDIASADLYANSLTESNKGGAAYTYGDRQCHFFGYDQLERASKLLVEEPNRAVVCQRYYSPYDIPRRHGLPCLVGESYFLSNGKLNVVHCVRSHDMFRAFASNMYGVGNAWAGRIAKEAGVPVGDLLGLTTQGHYYRKGADRANVEMLMRKVTTEPPRYAEGNVKPAFIEINSLDDLQRALIGLPVGPHVLGLRFTNPDILAKLPSIEGKWPLSDRIYSCRPFNKPDAEPLDQVKAVGEWLKTQSTDNGAVISPRDPVLDRDREESNIVFIQPREHVGKMTLALFSINTLVNDSKDVFDVNYTETRRESPALQYRLAYDIQRQVAQACGMPLGELFVLHAPLYRAV